MRSSLWALIVTLSALPLSGQALPGPGCSPPGFPLMTEAVPTTDYQPLEAHQRLFYSLAGLPEAPVKVRYLVDGKLYATETIDLSKSELPQAIPRDSRSAGVAVPSDVHGFLQGERVTELLARRPDLVRQLHQLAKDGGRIDLEVVSDRRIFEALSFEELARRSNELLRASVVPVVAPSAVRGPALAKKEATVLRPLDYLADCGDCTETTPCDTECGYDPGKGGPVTCGEYGVCLPPTCECQWVSLEDWTPWYPYGFYPNQPTYLACLSSWVGGYREHELWVRVYRRDLIRRSVICPNCPSCSGCYIHEEVIGYQLGYTPCWLESVFTCFGGYKPCCSELCYVSWNTPCHGWC